MSVASTPETGCYWNERFEWAARERGWRPPTRHPSRRQRREPAPAPGARDVGHPSRRQRREPAPAPGARDVGHPSRRQRREPAPAPGARDVGCTSVPPRRSRTGSHPRRRDELRDDTGAGGGAVTAAMGRGRAGMDARPGRGREFPRPAGRLRRCDPNYEQRSILALDPALPPPRGAPVACERRLAAAVLAGTSVPAHAATTASFSPGAGVLTVFGDGADNTITVSRNAAGQILVNGGAVAVIGGRPTVANTALIQVFGLGGQDTITLDEANGALPAANLFGGDGNDTLDRRRRRRPAVRRGRQRHAAGQGRRRPAVRRRRQRHAHRRRRRRPGVRRRTATTG